MTAVVYTDLLEQDGVTGGLRTYWSPPENLNGHLFTLFGEASTLVFDLTSFQTSYLVASPTSLQLTPISGGGDINNAQHIYFVDEVAPDLFTLDNITARASVLNPNNLVSVASGDWDAVQESDTVFLSDVPFTFQFGQRYSLAGGWVDDATLKANWRRFWSGRVSHSNWNGRVCFIVYDSNESTNLQYYAALEAAGDTTKTPSIWIEDWKQHTGFSGVDMDSGRALHDMKSGLPAMAGELVEDGYYKGAWTTAENWDDEDRRGEVELPSSEGKVRDRVPQ